MTDPHQIPSLIKLLEDDSPDILKSVMRELSAFGPTLRRELKNLPFVPSSRQSELLDTILVDQKKYYLQQQWSSWSRLKSDADRLERAVSLLSDFLTPGFENDGLSAKLDDLAEQFRQNYLKGDERQLAKFLFKDFGLSGNEQDYYNPQNSNLAYVIKEKRGIPISLSCVYILVGSRVGLKIEGCHYPGHFLSRFSSKDQMFYIDCYSQGQLIEEKDVIWLRDSTPDDMRKILHERSGSEPIVRRYLANLIRAFQIDGNEESCGLMVKLFKTLDQDDVMKDFNIDELTPELIIGDSALSFKQGQIVRHMRYGYRGIIVDVDDYCKASDNWYYGNQTQPSRDQLWFHILVHGSDQVTYVAQSHLQSDRLDEAVDHPLLTYFFSQDGEGSYIRNENEWPDMDL